MTRRQLDLFTSEAEAERTPTVRPASGDLDGARLPTWVRGGTSSWTFPGWGGGLVYEGHPDSKLLARDGLRAYARRGPFRAVGLDKTFYRPAPTAEFERLASQVDEDFRFLVKAHRDCTSVFVRDPADDRRMIRNPRFLDAAYAATAVVEPAALGLGARLGVILFQFSPQRVFEGRGGPRLVERLGAYMSGLPRGVPYAVELRNANVLGPRYGAALAAAGARHAFTVHPTMPSLSGQVDALRGEELPGGRVVRWMLGHGQSYEGAKGRYAPFDAIVDEDPDTREEVCAVLEAAALRSPRAHSLLVINNKAEGCSPRSVLAVGAALRARAARRDENGV